MTEEELRQAVAASRQDGFRALFQQYHSYVYAVVWGHIRRVGTAEDAEECVSDVFADVFLHFDAIPPGSLQSYLGTAARRNAIDRFRSLSARQKHCTAEALDTLAADSHPALDYENAERSRLLYEAVCALGEPDATLIFQKYFYGRKSGDIARDCRMSPVAVRVRLSRALKRLKQRLTEQDIL